MFRSPARIFAPLSLVACAVAVLVIVNHNNSDEGGSTTRNPPAATSTVTTSNPAKKKTPKSYVVKNGDVLSEIAIKTGVSLDTIIRLNPNVDAQTLHAGQKLKLAP